MMKKRQIHFLFDKYCSYKHNEHNKHEKKNNLFVTNLKKVSLNQVLIFESFNQNDIGIILFYVLLISHKKNYSVNDDRVMIKFFLCWIVRYNSY